MASRKIEDLHPKVMEKAKDFLAKCAEQGIDVLIYCTYRSQAEQAELYAIGRTTPGKIVTNAKPGYSYHNWGLAFDCVPLINGKPMWDSKNPMWQKLGELGKSVGLEWAGDWKKFKEYPHFQLALYPIEDLVEKRVDDPFITN